MKRISFNEDWFYDEPGNKMPVILPHDAMIHETRRADSIGGSGHGYFCGGIYKYEKSFEIPDNWKGKKILLEFEGIYKNSEIFINGEKAGGHPYGYTGFTVDISEFINYGAENSILVSADNSKLPNSRWYTGGGIYRPVWMWVGDVGHIAYEGVKITTTSYRPARIHVEVKTENPGKAVTYVEILDGSLVIASAQGNDVDIDIPEARLWCDETPNLYTCRVALKHDGGIMDEVTEKFGIRKIEWGKSGLFINGRETLLRGGCIHHDNGILGAASYIKSEERKVRIMKENGFNAIRSAHNPCSKALLDACDKYGMYLIDETFDMWYNRKNTYDYGLDFDNWWREDTGAMVERDYNHPSVIMYSIGNEVAEPFEEKGILAGKKQIDVIHRLDGSRPVTCGVNLMIIGRAAKGNGIYKDGEMNANAASGKKTKESGNASLAFNIIASFIGSGMNKGGNSKKVDALTTPFVDSLDIAGYNYGSGRYPLEAKAHPERVVFGSETFPQDICKNWKMVKRYPYLIGDFMWTAWDYLGESGIGAWSYTGGMPFNRPYPWLLGGAGVIDILGIPDASCKYASVVWGMEKKPVIGVRPVNHPGVKVSKSVWRGTNAVESWSWRGCQGNEAVVEVYADAYIAKLFINGKLAGQKKLKEYKALFKTKYTEGTLTAVVCDKSGQEISRKELQSASGCLRIHVNPEESSVKAGEIVYIPVSIIGENGMVESNADCKLKISVSNGELLGFGSANPCTEERYDSGNFTSYLGRALAVVRTRQAGTLTVTVEADRLQKADAMIHVE